MAVKNTNPVVTNVAALKALGTGTFEAAPATAESALRSCRILNPLHNIPA